MKLFIFKIKLIWHINLFILDLVFSKTKETKSLFLIVFIVFFFLISMFFYFIKIKINNQKIKNFSTYSPTQKNLYIKSEKTKLEIESEISFWENIVKKQPNSRDALINLYVLKKTIGKNSEETEKLWSKAKSIDPNNPVFQDN